MADTRFKKGQIPWNKVQWIDKVCKCGKSFSVKPSLDRVKSCSMSCAQKGTTSGMKGRKASAETREKQRQAKLGIRGKDHWNYKGYKGKTERKIAMVQDEYKKWRDKVFLRDNFTCQFCSQYSGALHADHIDSWKDNPELRYVVENGRTLCVPCHYYVTFKRKMMPGTKWCGFTARERG